MRTILVLPGSAMASAQGLLAAAGWRGEVAGDEAEGAAAAVLLAGSGRPALFMPEGIDPRAGLHRILVVHEGSRGDRAGMAAADGAAVASGAEVIVLHVPSRRTSTSPASLPVRMADHAAHDWGEWREEFLRRFGGDVTGVDVTLKVAAGSAAELRAQIARERPDLIIASARDPEPGDGDGMEALLDSPVPVLFVPSVGQAAEAELAGTASRT